MMKVSFIIDGFKIIESSEISDNFFNDYDEILIRLPKKLITEIQNSYGEIDVIAKFERGNDKCK